MTTDKQKFRIVYMGTPAFAVAGLRALIDAGFQVVGVVTAPDKPAGRGLQLTYSAVKEYALSCGIPVLQPIKLRDPEFLAQLSAWQADLFIVVAFRMLPEVVWQMPPKGTFNLHASLLPQYRGAAPINHAIIRGEVETGVTTFFIEKEIDTGQIILQKKIAIPVTWNAGQLHDALMQLGADAIVETTQAILENNCHPTPQPSTLEPLKTAPKIFPETCKIPFNLNSWQVYNHIRGLAPYPGAWALLNGQQVKVYAASPPTQQSFSLPALSIGEIYIHQQRFFVGVGANHDGNNITTPAVLELLELQLQGRKRLPAAEFIRGFRNLPSHFDV